LNYLQLILKQFEDIKKLLNDLKQESELPTTIIIVEGIKDAQALNNFGIVNNIIYLHGRSLTEVYDEAAKFKKIILLSDFDDFGQKLIQDLRQTLASMGLNADMSYYRQFKFYFKKVSKDVEGLFKIYNEVQHSKLQKMRL